MNKDKLMSANEAKKLAYNFSQEKISVAEQFWAVEIDPEIRHYAEIGRQECHIKIDNGEIHKPTLFDIAKRLGYSILETSHGAAYTLKIEWGVYKPRQTKTRSKK